VTWYSDFLVTSAMQGSYARKLLPWNLAVHTYQTAGGSEAAQSTGRDERSVGGDSGRGGGDDEKHGGHQQQTDRRADTRVHEPRQSVHRQTNIQTPIDRPVRAENL